MSLPQEAYHHFGHDAQLIALAEEASELAAAICRHLNGKGDVRAIIEEMVGVDSVAASLRDHLGTAREWAGVRAEQEAKLATKLGYDVDWSDAAGPRIINGPGGGG